MQSFPLPIKDKIARIFNNRSTLALYRWAVLSILVVVSGIILLVAYSQTAVAQDRTLTPLLMPIGGGYTEILPEFSKAAIANHHRGYVNILVLPITMASDPESITFTERQQALQTAENLRGEIEAACQQTAGYNYVCAAAVAPVLTREDAQNSDLLAYFNSELSAIFIPDGDPDIATHVIGGTLVEGALVRSHQQNVLIAGTGSGGSLQSTNLMVGYKPGFSPGEALNFNAVEVWGDAEKHGLLFGFQHEILDTEFFSEGNLGRLLNAISMPEFPHLGIGIDAGTGVNAPDGNQIAEVFGRTGVLVLDAETYHSANNIQYIGCGDNDIVVLPCTPLLSMRNVLVHMVAPGEFSYDLLNRKHSLADAQPTIERDYPLFQLPPAAGTLLLSGGIGANPENSAVLDRLQEASEDGESRILIVAAGYDDENQARKVSQRLGAMFIRSEALILSPDQSIDPDSLANYSGILVTAPDSSHITSKTLAPFISAWLTGTPLMLDDAAAALAGNFYASTPFPGEELTLQGLVASRSFLMGQVDITPGLNLLPVMIEPRLLDRNRWGRLFSLAYNHPENIAFGLNQGSGLEIDNSGAHVIGDRTMISLDLREAVLDQGENRAFVIANGLLDVFAPGEPLQPLPASIEAQPIQASTPALVTATATPLPTATITATPTVTPTPTATRRPTRTPRSPRPTATPLVIPPPSNPNMNQWLITLGSLIIITIIFGMLLNRRRFK
jgi:cyanophycinase-like exopeptidase